ncbi:hypothetical protein CH267_00830 [Rhodococcus sp. 06-621-2]|nr:hypothetical protein CH267_00830 [Rhodococcus sp. 06-621-2]
MAKRKRRSRSQCARCNQEVQWCQTRERGTPVALDPSPDPDDGWVRLQVLADKVYVDILAGDELAAAQADGESLFMLHSKTCSARKPFNPRPDHVKLELPPKRWTR